MQMSSKYWTEAVFRWELVRAQGRANRARSEKKNLIEYVYKHTLDLFF